MARLPFLKFFPADWVQDTQVLTLAGQGAWMKIICGLHVSPTYGSRTWIRPEFETFLGVSDSTEPTSNSILSELERVADIECRDANDNETEYWNDAVIITITCRRMVRDIARINSRKDSYKKYNHTRTTRKPQIEAKKSEAKKSESKKEDKKEECRDEPLFLPDWLNSETWADYRAFRKEIKHPLTERAERLAIKQLNVLRQSGNDPKAVIEQSIVSGWRGLFEVKSGRGHPDNQFSDRIQQALKRGL